MKLQFRLLLIDDTPDSVRQAVEALRDHLDERGFDLVTDAPTNISKQTVRSRSRNGGRDYDLVAVDYVLGSDRFDGGDMASILRRELPFTDIVFYSSNASLNLLERLAQVRVAGVFVATRDELDEALVGLADTVIGKAVDLNHMRGIAMAEVAEMDVMMEATLAETFRAAGAKLDNTANRTVLKVKKSISESSRRVDTVVQQNGIVGLIRNARLFPSAQKYFALKRVCNEMSPQPDLGVLASYEGDVIAKRNMLAHAKEVVVSGAAALQSAGHDGSPVTIDDAWMVQFRRTLRKHRSALEIVCNAIRTYFP